MILKKVFQYPVTFQMKIIEIRLEFVWHFETFFVLKIHANCTKIVTSSCFFKFRTDINICLYFRFKFVWPFYKLIFYKDFPFLHIFLHFICFWCSNIISHLSYYISLFVKSNHTFYNI